MKGKDIFSPSLAQSQAPPNDHSDRYSLLSSLVARRRGEWRVGTSLGLLSSFRCMWPYRCARLFFQEARASRVWHLSHHFP